MNANFCLDRPEIRLPFSFFSMVFFSLSLTTSLFFFAAFVVEYDQWSQLDVVIITACLYLHLVLSVILRYGRIRWWWHLCVIAAVLVLSPVWRLQEPNPKIGLILLFVTALCQFASGGLCRERASGWHNLPPLDIFLRQGRIVSALTKLEAAVKRYLSGYIGQMEGTAAFSSLLFLLVALQLAAWALLDSILFHRLGVSDSSLIVAGYGPFCLVSWAVAISTIVVAPKGDLGRWQVIIFVVAMNCLFAYPAIRFMKGEGYQLFGLPEDGYIIMLGAFVAMWLVLHYSLAHQPRRN